MISSVSLWELALVYAIPIIVGAVTWLAASFVVYALARWTGLPLSEDVRARIERKRLSRSGRSLRLNFRHVALSMAADNCFQATVFYRCSSSLDRMHMRHLAVMVHSLSKFVTHADISPRARIGPGFYLYHGLGTVIGKGSSVGRRALICQNVTLGGGASVGDDVCIWAGAKLIGHITVGDRAEIGANGVVVSDVPPDVIAVGVPATRFLPKATIPTSFDQLVDDSAAR
jgi:serine O-acetyltransferase